MNNSIRKRRGWLLLLSAILCMGGVSVEQPDKNERTQLIDNEKRSVPIDPNPIFNLELKDRSSEESLKSVARKLRAGLTYNSEVLPDKQVRLQMNEKPLPEALEKWQIDTGLEFFTSARKIMPRGKNPALYNRANHLKVASEQVTGSVTVAESGDTTVVEIRSEGVELSYSRAEIRAKAGERILIRYINDSDMTHNIVFVRKEKDIRPVGIAALQAVSNDWIPENEMDRIIAYSELAHSGDTVEVSFKVPPPGTYPYICTYSAHWTQMQGRLISTE